MELLLSEGNLAELKHQIKSMKSALAEQSGACGNESSECKHEEPEMSASSPDLQDSLHPVSVKHFVYPDCCTCDCVAATTEYFAFADSDDDHGAASGDECAAATWEVGSLTTPHCESDDADAVASIEAATEPADRLLDAPSVSSETSSKDAGQLYGSAESPSDKVMAEVHPRLMRAGFGFGLVERPQQNMNSTAGTPAMSLGL